MSIGNFYAGQGENTENLRACSSLGCVKKCPKMQFFAEIPCFFPVFIARRMCFSRFCMCHRWAIFKRDQKEGKPWLSTALIVYSAENVGFYIQKCTVCDFQNAKSAQISDITYTGKFSDADLLLIFCVLIKYNYCGN